MQVLGITIARVFTWNIISNKYCCIRRFPHDYHIIRAMISVFICIFYVDELRFCTRYGVIIRKYHVIQLYMWYTSCTTSCNTVITSSPFWACTPHCYRTAMDLDNPARYSLYYFSMLRCCVQCSKIRWKIPSSIFVRLPVWVVFLVITGRMKMVDVPEPWCEQYR